jgi:hypothetical protein
MGGNWKAARPCRQKASRRLAVRVPLRREPERLAVWRFEIPWRIIIWQNWALPFQDGRRGTATGQGLEIGLRRWAFVPAWCT